MKYAGEIIPGRFVARPNRFIAHIDTDAGLQVCHVKNTGRCRELLTPGAAVWLEKAKNPQRKTAFSLIAAEKPTGRGRMLINMDSQAPNKAFEAAAGRIFPGMALRREVRYGSSRFDFALDAEGPTTFVEIKGVTLEQDGLAMFPDAPTLRGVKHLDELADAAGHGFGACICFVVQMEGVSAFLPNDHTHRAFGDALRRARSLGVDILAYDCKVSPGGMSINAPVEIRL